MFEQSSQTLARVDETASEISSIVPAAHHILPLNQSNQPTRNLASYGTQSKYVIKSLASVASSTRVASYVTPHKADTDKMLADESSAT